MTTNAPIVASVLVVAHEARRPLLLPWLRVVGEPVSYAIETTVPDETLAHLRSSGSWWDLIVIDGESMLEDARREELLRELRTRSERHATVLYVCTRLPTELEARAAFEWADDQINQGWEFGVRLRRRAQALALAPWRRSLALRAHAERQGRLRLRVVRASEETR